MLLVVLGRFQGRPAPPREPVARSAVAVPRELKPGLVSRLPVRLVVPALPWALSAVLIGCSAGSTASPSGSIDPVGTAQVHVVLTNAGCVPDRAGWVRQAAFTFSIVNEGGDAVSEVEPCRATGSWVSVEDLAPGLSGSFTLALEPGDYALAWRGATTPQSPFEGHGGGRRAPFSASWRRRDAERATSVYGQRRVRLPAGRSGRAELGSKPAGLAHDG